MAHKQLDAVRGEIGLAARRAGRQPGSITLVAVSKTFGADDIVPVLAAGHKVFGENRVQEAQGKWPGLKERFAGAQLHLIGPLQTNKAADAVALFDCIHTVDRLKLAKVLAGQMARQQRALELFIQVNTGMEPQKAGVAPHEADGFIARCTGELGLNISGLMCIPPFDEEPVPHFLLLEKIALRNGLAKLSMGMSKDFGDAIAAGATHVRVGTAIFGKR